MSKKFIFVFAITTGIAQSVWSQGVAPSSPAVGSVTTTTVSASVTVTTIPTIQTSGQNSSGNNGVGMIMGIGIAGFCAYKAVGYCSTCASSGGFCGECALNVAGVVVGGIVITQMSSAKGSSDATVGAVTIGGFPTSPADGSNNTNVGSPSSNALNSNPTWQGYKANVAKLATYGVKINPNGTFTTKDGKTYNAQEILNGSGAAAAGINGKQMAAFTASINAEKKKLEAQAKGADSNTDSYGESVGGSGKSSASYGGGLGVPTMATGPKLGLDRNPAQVAGMSVKYGGEQIGVAADSLFDMVDRRYKLHTDKGSFLTPGL